MNWYEKLKLKEKRPTSEDDIRNLMDQKLLNSDIIKLIDNLPPGFKLKQEPEGWSVVKEDEQGEHSLSFDEPTPEYALRGGKARMSVI